MKTIEQRLREKIDVRGEDECWPWIGARKKLGHGTFWTGTRFEIASRAVLMYIEGVDIPSGMYVCHHCDNGWCCNPKHLYIGNAETNTRDKMERGRHNYASRTHCSNGHPYSGDNLRIAVNGQRICRTCYAEYQKKYRVENAARLQEYKRLKRQSRNERIGP